MNVEERGSLPLVGVDEALEVVLGAVSPLPAEEISLEAALGRFLAEEVHASADMPPFDRTAMDGYAVRADDLEKVPAILSVVEEIAAGHDPVREVGPGEASRIMTGAAIPGGADSVVVVECTEALEGGRRVRVLESPKRSQHIRRAGEDLPKGALLLEPGTCLGAPEIALLAAEGRARVRTGRIPSVAVLSTGDELVGIDQTPRGSRIRETNSWSLAALLRRMRIEPRLLGIARDNRAALVGRIREGLAADVLILSGGVSMGERDLVGAALKECGCLPLFERVAIQPGKPLFFGVVDRRPGSAVARPQAGGGASPVPEERFRVVFGLPGNPVSSIVDFLVFARPALRALMGSRRPVEPMPSAALAEPLQRKPGRRAYLPARVDVSPDGNLTARALPSMGSADLVALSRANALIVVPEDEGSLGAGERVSVLLLDDASQR